MKTVSLILSVSISILLASDLATPQEKSPRIGVGVSLGKELVAYTYYPHYWWWGDYYWGMPSIDFPSIYIPIIVSPKFRLEPEIGFWWLSRSGYSSTILRIGWGMFSIERKKQTNLYQGLRVGVILKDDYTSTTDIFIGPALGGEYLFSSHFSLGGEAQLNFVYCTNADSRSTLSTKVLSFLRWYF